MDPACVSGASWVLLLLTVVWDLPLREPKGFVSKGCTQYTQQDQGFSSICQVLGHHS